MNPWLPVITHIRWALDLALHAPRAPKKFTTMRGWPSRLMSQGEKLDLLRHGRLPTVEMAGLQ